MQKDQKKKTNYFLLSSIFGMSFLFLSFLVNKDLFRNIDFDLLTYFQATFGRFVDLPFSILTLLGSTEVSLSIIFFVFAWLYIRKKHLFTGIFLIFAIYVIELIGKIFIYHPKPPIIFNRYALDIFFPSSFVVSTSYSYPSGHMARATFIALIALFILTKRLKDNFQRKLLTVTASLFILGMFISRIYLGEHWLSDVLGGLLLGGGLAALAMGFW